MWHKHWYLRPILLLTSQCFLIRQQQCDPTTLVSVSQGYIKAHSAVALDHCPRTGPLPTGLNLGLELLPTFRALHAEFDWNFRHSLFCSSLSSHAIIFYKLPVANWKLKLWLLKKCLFYLLAFVSKSEKDTDRKQYLPSSDFPLEIFVKQLKWVRLKAEA